MPEDFDDKPTKQFDIELYFDIIRRRHILFLLILFAGWLLVWTSSWILPPRYKSSTLIIVEQPTVPTKYVEPNINDNLQDRLQSITQQILSRTHLLLIIDKLHLYSGKRHLLTPDEKVERMQKDIDIELVRDPQNAAITAFKINYSAPDPHTAQKVTSELTNLFINENLRVRQQQSEDTTRFMETQLAAARTSLAEQEAKVREFQAAHQGELPSQQTTNLQILSGLQSQLQNEQDALNTAMQQKVYLQTLIDQYRKVQIVPRPDGATPAGLPAIDGQLDKLRAQLADLTSQYTDRYPAVQNLEDQITQIEKERADLVATLKTAAAKKDKNADSDSQLTDPAENASLLQLEGQQRANQAEIVDRERSIADLKARIGSYQARLNAAPTNEQQLDDLTRGYDQSKANYDDLLKKENESQMATSMEEMQQGERFTMLDPPSQPLKPSFPNRLKMCGAGFGVGLALGALVVGLLEFLDDRLRSDNAIKDLLPVAVIAEIPQILSPADESRNRRRMIVGSALAAVVFGVILAGTAFSYLHA